ncbi:tryptophan--tRNA ligase [Actinoplanes teichomyceticus]|uniref:Tryptophan--tRNA ligase n=1 Tax=Actinoplanes teichomyceticus TaxID=1867 RepID=A0A561WI53_ACTTI|nr:tryptophan--tRNA ligase [Actinoplanes teichomyceticus]TWG23490.1 tryptophanyl-tRNA synthetase [Actinoplanes teichomyceticus]GIF16113.1 tryptophan--tRNA ligase 1 [Actinoplanes teichomyceticus]
MTTTVTTAPARTRRLSGFQPTGHLHLGNLLGALRPLVTAQDAAESIALIADLHAMTVEHDPAEVRTCALEQATVMLAAGVDPERTPIVLQSQVREHTELHYLLECVAGYGEAARMIQFKEKSAAGGPVRLSLLTYPVLMAADILLYDVTQVPVGADQDQHLELTRSLATRFNTRYGRTFVVPEGVRPDSAARIMDLADPATKMGKSSGSGAGRIALLDPPEVIRRTVARAATDTVGLVRRDRVDQPGITNLIDILAACTGRPPADPTSYAALKREVADAVEALLAPIRARHAELAADPGHVRRVLAAGAERVRPIAAETVRRARAAIGLLD